MEISNKLHRERLNIIKDKIRISEDMVPVRPCQIKNLVNSFIFEEASKAKFVAVMYDSCYCILQPGEDDYEIFANKEYQKLLSFSDDLEKLKAEIINSLYFKVGGEVLQSNRCLMLKRDDGSEFSIVGATLNDNYKVFSITFKKDKPEMSYLLCFELSKSFDDFFEGSSHIVHDINSFVPDFKEHLEFASEISEGTVKYDMQEHQYFFCAKGMQATL